MNPIRRLWEHQVVSSISIDENLFNRNRFRALLFICGCTVTVFLIYAILTIINPFSVFSSPLPLILIWDFIGLFFTILICWGLLLRKQWKAAQVLFLMGTFIATVTLDYAYINDLYPILFYLMIIFLTFILQSQLSGWIIVLVCLFSHFIIRFFYHGDSFPTAWTSLIVLSGVFLGVSALFSFLVEQYHSSFVLMRQVNGRSQTEVEERKRSEKLKEVLYQISEATNQVQNLDELFRRLHEIIGNLLPAKNLYIALFDPKEGIIHFPYHVDEKDKNPGFTFPGHGLTQAVLKIGNPVLLSEDWPELQAQGVTINGVPPEDWLGSPLKNTAGTVIGVLAIQTYTPNERYNAEHKSVLNYVSFHIGIAIERAQAQEQLRKSEERYRLIVQNQGEGIAITDLENKFIYVNPAGEKIFGVEPGKLVGRCLSEFSTQEGFLEFSTETEKRKKGVTSSYENEIIRPSGERIVLLITATPEYDDTNTVMGSFVIFRDITDRKIAEEKIRVRNRDLALLNRVLTAATSTLKLEAVLQVILNELTEGLGAPQAGIALMEPDGKNLRVTVEYPIQTQTSALGVLIPIQDNPSTQMVIETQVPLAIENVHTDPRLDSSTRAQLEKRNVHSILILPLTTHGQVIGTIGMDSFEPKIFTSEDITLAGNAASAAAQAIENARLYTQIQHLAITDELTHLLNRRGLNQFGQHEFDRARRFMRPLSIVFLDIDHFKIVNDSWGHHVGDEVLKELANRIKQNIREVDLAGRYGGEEFIFLLPEVDLTQAVEVAERLRQRVSSIPFAVSIGEVNIQISLGVSAYKIDTPTLQDLIAQADQAMYLSKQNGRNRVSIR